MADTWVISDPNKAKLRSDGQHSRNYLCIPQPATVLKASLSALPTSTVGAVADLPITVISGSIANVLPDMTCLVMNSTETTLLGIVRIRKAPITGTLYISEDNNEISRRWVVGNRLIVLDEFGLWPRHLRVEDEDTFYADWDIEYSDQHEHPDPAIRFGPPIIPVWKTGSTVAVAFDGAASAIPFGSDTIASWLWTASAGSVASSTTHSPTVTLSATGRVRVKAQATSSASKVWSRYAYIEAYNAARMPITEFELTSPPEASADGGGWSFGVRMYGEADLITIRDRALVALFSDDYYLNVKESLGPVPGREHQVVWGWIAGETIDWDAEGGFVSFEVKGADHWLGMCSSYPAGLEDTDFADNGGGAPNRWTEMEDLTVDKALWHFSHWRSTIDRVCDAYFTGDVRQAAQIPSAAPDLWSQLKDFANATLLALPAFDRYGRLWVQLNQQHIPLDERDDIPVIVDLTSDDHVQVNITRRTMPRCSQVAISGVYYASGQSAPVGAYSPGKTPIAPAEEGPREETELVVGNQADTLEWAGLIAGSGEGEIDRASIEIPRNYRWFDIAPHAWVTVTVASTDTERGITLTEARLIPRRITLPWDDEAGCWGVSLECEGEGVQIGGVEMEFPGEGEPEPEPNEPPEPPVPPENETPEEPEPGVADAVAAIKDDIRSSADIDQATPTWVTETSPVDLIVDTEQSGDFVYVLGERTLWEGTGVGGGAAIWTKVLDAASYVSELGDNVQFSRVIERGGRLYVVGGVVGETTGDAWFFRSQNGGLTWNHSMIAAASFVVTPYTLTSGTVTITKTEPTGSVTGAVNHVRYGDDTAAVNPLAAGWAVLSNSNPPWIWIGYLLEATSINSFGSGTGLEDLPEDVYYMAVNSLLDTGKRAAVVGYLDAYFGGPMGTAWERIGATLYREMLKDPARTQLIFDIHHDMGTCTIGTLVFWDKPNPFLPIALDASKTNPDWVYVGSDDVIYKSEDGGYTWIALLEDDGAYDIHVDPQLGGVIYAWRPSGKLDQIVAGVVNATLDTETALRKPLRIARSHNNGKLWTLKSGAALRLRNLATWSDQQSGLSNGTGLHAYPGDKLIFVDGGDVYISDDGGVVVTAKKGDWVTFTDGVNAHRLV